MFAASLRSFRIASSLLTLLPLLVSLAFAQTKSKEGPAPVEGTVCDAQNHPLPAATVSLENTRSGQTFVVHTDEKGRFRFAAIPAGTYTLHTNMPGYHEASKAPLLLAQNEAISVVLLLEPDASAPFRKTVTQTVEFSDEPEFTVAGLTDPTNLGGHGSDVAVRTKEALAKETTSLNRGAPDRLPPPLTPPAGAKSSEESAESGPEGFLENKKRGEQLVGEGKPQQAIPYLERASLLKTGDSDVRYALAVAYEQSGDTLRADQNVRMLLAREDRPELHALLGDIAEREGHPLEAVQEYQRAAEMQPNEANLFSWGAELLLHRAAEPAAEVFTKGYRLFPNSVRMLVGLAVTSYVRGSYEQSSEQLLHACDLNPADPSPYLFLGRIQEAEKVEPPGWTKRLQRFVNLQPENPLAYYYYAVGLAKEGNVRENLELVESLLQKAIRLDSHFGDAHLQLGILYSERKDFPKAIAAYQKAIETTPLPDEAHFRLAEAYRQTGETQKVRQEIETYNQISQEKAKEAERDRHEIQQFVYTLRGRTTPAPPPPATP
jgi:tetratricopeptide (TPR) repeat protein